MVARSPWTIHATPVQHAAIRGHIRSEPKKAAKNGKKRPLAEASGGEGSSDAAASADVDKEQEFRKFAGGFYIAFAGQRGIINARIFGGTHATPADQVSPPTRTPATLAPWLSPVCWRGAVGPATQLPVPRWGDQLPQGDTNPRSSPRPPRH